MVQHEDLHSAQTLSHSSCAAWDIVAASALLGDSALAVAESPDVADPGMANGAGPSKFGLEPSCCWFVGSPVFAETGRGRIWKTDYDLRVAGHPWWMPREYLADLLSPSVFFAPGSVGECDFAMTLAACSGLKPAHLVQDFSLQVRRFQWFSAESLLLENSPNVGG